MGNRVEKEKVTSVLYHRIRIYLLIFVVDPLPAEVFKAGQVELARDLIIREQQIELLISKLPGLETSEKDQEQLIQQLEEELKIAEQERKEAQKQKEAVLARLENVIRSVKRP